MRPVSAEKERKLDDTVEKHLARTKRLADQAVHQATRRKGIPRKETRQANIKKAQEALRIKQAQIKLIKEKIRNGFVVSPEEHELIAKSSTVNKVNRADAAQALVDMASKLVIKPQTVQALRLVVEQTAAKHKYNPIDELIKLTKSEDLGDKDKVAIHKALMPFLIPAVAPASSEEEATPEDQRPKIIIKNFHMGEKDARPIHETKKEELMGPEITIDAEPNGQE